MSQAWWHRIHVPVEIKLGKKEDDVLAALQQLCAYMRQVFREQLDRRFVLGLAFCETNLSVWLCDRSGLLGTETMFNIHKVGAVVELKMKISVLLTHTFFRSQRS